MSSRRFAAYFFAIAAGSTFAFATTLRGQPPEQAGTAEAAARQAAMDGGTTESGMTPTATDLGADALPETARLFRQTWDRRHRPAARTMRAK